MHQSKRRTSCRNANASRRRCTKRSLFNQSAASAIIQFCRIEAHASARMSPRRAHADKKYLVSIQLHASRQRARALLHTKPHTSPPDAVCECAGSPCLCLFVINQTIARARALAAGRHRRPNLVNARQRQAPRLDLAKRARARACMTFVTNTPAVRALDLNSMTHTHTQASTRSHTCAFGLYLCDGRANDVRRWRPQEPRA